MSARGRRKREREEGRERQGERKLEEERKLKGIEEGREGRGKKIKTILN